MTKDELEKSLQGHKKNKSFLNQVLFDIEIIENELKKPYFEYKETKEEAIEGEQLKGMDTSVIRSKTNNISRPTENVALDFANASKTIVYKNNVDRIEITSKLEKLKVKKNQLELIINVIDNALAGVTHEKKDILEWYYMDQPKWNYVQIEYINKYQEPRSIKQLQNVRDSALIELLNIINFSENI